MSNWEHADTDGLLDILQSSAPQFCDPPEPSAPTFDITTMPDDSVEAPREAYSAENDRLSLLREFKQITADEHLCDRLAERYSEPSPIRAALRHLEATAESFLGSPELEDPHSYQCDFMTRFLGLPHDATPQHIKTMAAQRMAYVNQVRQATLSRTTVIGARIILTNKQHGVKAPDVLHPDIVWGLRVHRLGLTGLADGPEAA